MVHSSLILASASPRRSELLQSLGLTFEVDPPGLEEDLDPSQPPECETIRLAKGKARAVQGRASIGAALVAADSLVVLGNKLLTKPASPRAAAEMLRALRGREHRVVTGVAVARAKLVVSGSRTTCVTMREYSDEEIEAYVGSGDPMDKAGAYAIQHPQFRPVASIDGCYCNVVGLPLGLVVRLLAEAGVPHPVLNRPPQCSTCPDWDAPDGSRNVIAPPSPMDEVPSLKEGSPAP